MFRLKPSVLQPHNHPNEQPRETSSVVRSEPSDPHQTPPLVLTQLTAWNCRDNFNVQGTWKCLHMHPVVMEC